MSMKDSVRRKGMELASDPRVLKLMQHELLTKAMLALVQVPGKVNAFTSEQQERFARNMALAPVSEVADLRRIVVQLEHEVKHLNTRLAELEATGSAAAEASTP